eukprot:Skav232970  [mRNA]  locus=scaffold1735:277929:278849:+ [translate_table: standard]
MGISIGCTRSLFETCSNPLCFCYRGECCGGGNCDTLPEETELGTREDLLHALGACARLCYGTGLFDMEGSDWGQLDPPLDGEGWIVIDQICETMNSEETVQAGLYVPEWRNLPIAIVAFRGTCSLKGVRQSVSVGSLLFRRKAKSAVKEACSFLAKCRKKLPHHHIYVTGHSLGGFIAEACASYMDSDGAAFNSPGPLAMTPWRRLVGSHRPDFEVHLTREDPLALSLFPKPESHRHIAVVEWHPGQDHKICQPYVKPITAMKYRPNRLRIPTGQQIVNQMEDLKNSYPPPEELRAMDEDHTWFPN